MKLEELKFIGSGLKLRVLNDCRSPRGFGLSIASFKKGEILVCYGWASKGDETYFRVLQNVEHETGIFYDEVELVDAPYDITKTKPIKSKKDLYEGMPLIVTRQSRELGVGQRVRFVGFKNTTWGRDTVVSFEYDGGYITNDRDIDLDYLAIPIGERTKKEIVSGLIDHLKDGIPLTEEEEKEAINLLETLI